MADQQASALNLDSLKLVVADRIAPFFDRILAEKKGDVLALHVIGSAVTDDFDPERSDINSMIVLREMDLGLLDLLASLRREFQASRIGPPMLMTSDYIERWHNVSPVELLDVKLVNSLVYGADYFSHLDIGRVPVRLQCKRELRNRLIALSRGYVRASASKRELTELMVDSVYGLAPLIRGIIYARGDEPPVTIAPLFDALASFIGGAALSFKEVYWTKLRETKMPIARVRAVLKDYYRSIETLIDLVDKIETPNT